MLARHRLLQRDEVSLHERRDVDECAAEPADSAGAALRLGLRVLLLQLALEVVAHMEALQVVAVPWESQHPDA